MGSGSRVIPTSRPLNLWRSEHLYFSLCMNILHTHTCTLWTWWSCLCVYTCIVGYDLVHFECFSEVQPIHTSQHEYSTPSLSVFMSPFWERISVCMCIYMCVLILAIVCMHHACLLYYELSCDLEVRSGVAPTSLSEN